MQMVQWYNGTMSNERRSMQTSSTPRSDALQQPKECFATAEGTIPYPQKEASGRE